MDINPCVPSVTALGSRERAVTQRTAASKRPLQVFSGVSPQPDWKQGSSATRPGAVIAVCLLPLQ